MSFKTCYLYQIITFAFDKYMVWYLVFGFGGRIIKFATIVFLSDLILFLKLKFKIWLDPTSNCWCIVFLLNNIYAFFLSWKIYMLLFHSVQFCYDPLALYTSSRLHKNYSKSHFEWYSFNDLFLNIYKNKRGNKFNKNFTRRNF